MKGTRKEVLFQLEQWSRGEREKCVFWLSGLAGTGKSTIARTFAEMCFADGKLGASFFCSRDFDERKNLRSILPTLAFQLAHRYPRFRQELLPVLRRTPMLDGRPFVHRWRSLLLDHSKQQKFQPSLSLMPLTNVKIRNLLLLFSLLSRYVDKIPLVKFFITGRPELHISSGFCLGLLQPHTDILKLHEVEPSSVDGDIKLFLKAQFIEISKNQSDYNFEEDWPGPHNIDIMQESSWVLHLCFNSCQVCCFQSSPT